MDTCRPLCSTPEPIRGACQGLSPATAPPALRGPHPQPGMRSAPARVCTHGHPLTQRCARGPGPLPPGRTALLHGQLQRGGRGQRGPQDRKSRLAGQMGIRAPPGPGSFFMAGSYSFVPRGPSPAHNTAQTQDLPTERRLHKACTSPRARMAVCAPAHTCPRPVARHARACLAHLHTRRHVHKHARSRLCTCTGPGEFGERRVTRAHAEPRVTGRGCGAEGPASGAAQDGAGATGRGGDGRGGQGGGRARAPSPGLPRQRAALRPPPPQPRASRRGPSRRRPQGAGSGPPGPAPVGGTGPAGQGAKAPREAARNPGRSPALPRPPPARPRGRGSAGAELPRGPRWPGCRSSGTMQAQRVDPGTRA